ncbi:hypothetical protein [Acidithiobacillus sp.]
MCDLEIHRKALNKLSRELRPIAVFLDDPGVTDIFLNPDGRIWLDGNRFEGLIPSIVSNPVFAIRKKALIVFTLADYVEKGSMTPEQHGVIESAILTRQEHPPLQQKIRTED